VADVPDEALYGFSWRFLDEMSWWSLGIAVAISALVTVATRNPAFATGCLIAAGVDVVMVRMASHHARREIEAGRVDAVAPAIMLAGRLVVKALLLVLSLVVPGFMSFAGTVAGVLVLDVTLAFVGGTVAVMRTMRHTREGR
jgi:hypothetical protein